MASPRVIIQILLSGTQILGKAFVAAGKQAAKNAKSAPAAAMGGDVAGVGNATSGSVTDQLTRKHRMTLDEAHLILNVKKEDEMATILKHYEHMFKANSPAIVDPTKAKAPPKPPTRGGKAVPLPPTNSHYLQSKVWRARERLEAEAKASQEPPHPPPGGPGPVLETALPGAPAGAAGAPGAGASGSSAGTPPPGAVS